MIAPVTAPDITLDAIRDAHARLTPYVRETPIWRWEPPPAAGEVILKLELLQHTGSFKARGALCAMLDLDADALARGVTAISAGNHAIAVAWAARVVGTTAKVIIPRTASPIRVARAQAYGAEVVLVDDVHEAFATVRAIETNEGRTLVHPFEGPRTALGTATLGLEWWTQAGRMDAIVVPIGGGGLIAGIATGIKLLDPTCQVFGVEPVGADSMTRSLRAGSPQSIDKVRTIADSLGAPHAAPYSFDLVRRHVDEVLLLDDEPIQRAMGRLFAEVKLACEPAGATATAALCGPLRERLAGKRVGVMVCGSNIDLDTFHTQAR